MNDFVSQLLELEQQARQIVDAARQYYDQQIAATEQEKNELLAQYTTRAEHHVREQRESEAAETGRIVTALEQQCNTLIAAMNRTADEQAATWRAELVARCTQGKS